VPPSVSLAHSKVKPGQQQTVTVRADPGVKVSLNAVFPNGPKISAAGDADSSGTATVTFTQPANAVTRKSQTAKVGVRLTSPTSGQSTALSPVSYTIGYGKIDISASRISAHRSQVVTIWIHSHARTTVSGQVRLPGAAARKFTVKTNTKGWAAYKYHLTRSLAAGQTVSITGRVKLKGQVYRTALAAVVR
jgi:hypothetical protein